MRGEGGASHPGGSGLLARHLRQQGEMGRGGLHLESLSPGDLLALGREARRRGALAAAAPEGSGPEGVLPGGAAPTPGVGAPSGRPAVPTAPSAPHAAPVPGRASPPAMEAPRVASQNGGAGKASPGEGAGADTALELPDTLEALQALCGGCVRCGLAETRQEVVFADGNPEARVMVVGEAPGANEDATGLPFVGAAGKLLDLLLASVDLSREASVYICNVIKCRPPGNRNPTASEIETCSPYLLRQIELVRPRVILAVGTFAGKLLTGEDRTLGELRGRVHRYHDTPLVVTYHPAALLRNPGWVRPTWEDLQLLASVVDGREVTA